MEVFKPKTGRAREAAEIWRETPITPAAAPYVHGETDKRPADTYRLPAVAPVSDVGSAALEAELAGRERGRQVMVRGVLDAIGCALLTLDGMDGFVARYAELVEDDVGIKYAHKMVWNNAVHTAA